MKYVRECDKPILDLIRKYDKEEYEKLFTVDKTMVEDHLDWLMEEYTLEELEENLKNNPKFVRWAAED